VTTIAWVALLILLVNLPFGMWRARVQRYSPAWFVAVHAPVPLAVGMRYAVGLGWAWRTLPVFVAAFFAGQLLGGRLHRRAAGRRASDAAPMGLGGRDSES